MIKVRLGHKQRRLLHYLTTGRPVHPTIEFLHSIAALKRRGLITQDQKTAKLEITDAGRAIVLTLFKEPKQPV